MKAINKLALDVSKKVFETSYFKVTFILIIFVSIYGGYLGLGLSYLESFDTILSTPMYFSFGIFLPFLVTTLCTINIFDKNEYLILRLYSRKQYLKMIICTSIIVNTLVFIMILLMLMISLNIFPHSGFGFVYNEFHNSHNLLYLVFHILKLFCIIHAFCIFNILLSKTIDLRILVGLNAVLYGSFIFFNSTLDICNSVFDIPFYMGNHLIALKYGNFILEITCTIMYILILFLIDYLLYLIIRKKLGDINI